MCIDFIDMNVACLKDNLPLPKIDLLVDIAAGYELLIFIDFYSDTTKS